MSDNIKQQTNGAVGSVMVVGGGIGGVQAALDLAESGFYVYLVERSTAIGGTMSQLDKTFPTNDCAMCILSPKVVECGRNLNIELLTNSEVEAISGEPGHFQVDVLKRPRFIDLEKCTACGECIKVCPVVKPNEYDELLSERHATFKRYPQAIPSGFAIDKLDRPPCVKNCPGGVNPQGYINLIREERYDEALKLIYEALPLPGVVGRICPHPCEDSCRRQEVDQPVAICTLKRYVADQVDIDSWEIPEIDYKDEKIAIIGSGPAGLSAAYYLGREGYRSTIFEALPKAGGMLRVGIPDYRLPPEVLDKEIEYITKFGADLKLNHPIDKENGIDSLFEQGYKAVYLAMGLHGGNPLPIPGADLDGVLQGVDFLRNLSLGGGEPPKGKRVVVIGGGNVAIDVARSARRIGFEEVELVCLEQRDEMPAHDWECDEALAEDIKFNNGWGPIRILDENGKVTGVEFKRCTSVFDENGKFSPKYDESETMSLDGEFVIMAIGQRPQTEFLGNGDGVKLARWGGVEADAVTFETARPGVFAGGDVVTGPGAAITAIGAGHEAAISIVRYLKGEDLGEGRKRPDYFTEDLAPIPDDIEKQDRCEAPMISRDLWTTSFQEINRPLSREEALKEAERCLNCGGCCECFQCVEACKPEAIDHFMPEEHVKLDVGAVILAPGFDPVDPKMLGTYGYGRFKNVISAKEFERILSASGPFQGHMVRLSDHKEPERIAWIQCAGSRNVNEGDHGYCSSVCCMYAIKQAVIAKEHAPGDLDTTIFFMDMRTFGKDFEKYYDRARDEHGVRFVRSRIHSIIEDPETQDTLVRYVDEEGKVYEEAFDMVVLSTGMEPAKAAVDLAERVGIELNHYNFCKTEEFAPVSTSKPGIFVCGAFETPKDIPETVMQASSAAAKAQALLAPARNTCVKEKSYPDEIDVSSQEPRIGVFVCDCGINIASVVNVPEVRDYAATLSGVVFASESLFTCSQDHILKMIEIVKENELNRVVVASCSPRTHEPLFRETIRQAGLNPYLFEMANIRDQASWVHQKEPEAATAKAKDLVRMAVAKVRNAKPLEQLTVPIENSALVIGGGVAGMNSALNIADQGYKVYLVEKSDQLGGIARKVHYTLEGGDVIGYLDKLEERVKKHANIELLMETEVVGNSGFIGNYKSTIAPVSRPYATQEINHGATIVATGAKAYEPKDDDYLYSDSDVLTSLELEERIAENDPSLKDLNSVVMIQCVGSRNEEHPYCSRICCQGSVKNALRLKEINPDMQVFVLYRDIRTYGLAEDYYREAREKGVLFIRFDRDNPPVVERTGEGLTVRVRDHVLREDIEIPVDVVSLAIGITGDQEQPVALAFKLPLNADGFFMEAHMKLRPVDFSSEGNYLAGIAHGPKPMKDAIAQAEAAAARAVTLLSKDKLYLPGEKAFVHEEKCVACLTCVRACPYHVPHIGSQGVAVIEPAECQGCGICTSACPRKAIELGSFSDDEILAKVAALNE